MRTLFAQPDFSQPDFPQSSKTLGRKRLSGRNPSQRDFFGSQAQSEQPQNEPPVIQLEIPVTALQRLLTEHKLVVEEIHCLNQRSKNLIRQALLDSLLSSVG